MTILVVEDEPEVLAPLVHSLKREGYRVIEASDGLAACRMIGSMEPDLLLLDIMLPDLDGWEVCRMLRQHPVQRIAATPVIMLTALSSPSDKFRGLELGADAYLPKPYSIREILLHAVNLVKRRRQTIELEETLEEVARKDEERSNLTHLLFHELRNQLLILNGYTQLLGSGKETSVCMDAIHRSSEYLNNLAEDMLLIRKVQGGQYTLTREQVSVRDVIDEIIRLYATQARERAATLKVRIANGISRIQLNKPSLKIILSTLLDNALKYGPHGQVVSLHCRQTSTQLDILVADQGGGIPPEESERIFEPFYRAGHARKVARGSGFGLYGVKVLCRAMNGDITVENGPENNCCFRVQLPAEAD